MSDLAPQWQLKPDFTHDLSGPDLIHPIKKKITPVNHLLAGILTLSTIAGLTSCSEKATASTAQPSTATATAPADKEQAFIAAIRVALEKRDIKAMDPLLLKDGTPAEVVAVFSSMLDLPASIKIGNVELLTPSAEEAAEYNQAIEMPDGKKYKLPITPTKTLVMMMKEEGAKGTSKSTLPVAEKDGKLVIPFPVAASRADGEARKLEKVTVTALPEVSATKAPPAGTAGRIAAEVATVAKTLLNNATMLSTMKPNAEQISAMAASSDDAKRITAYVEELFADLPPTGLGADPGQEEVIAIAQKDLPPGYQSAAAHLSGKAEIYGFKYVTPGETKGMAYDGLIRVEGKWVMIPQLWKAFSK